MFVGSGLCRQLLALAHLVIGYDNLSHGRREYLPQSERMMLAADIERICRATSWSPRIALEDTLKDLAVAYGLQAEPHPAA